MAQWSKPLACHAIVQGSIPGIAAYFFSSPGRIIIFAERVIMILQLPTVIAETL